MLDRPDRFIIDDQTWEDLNMDLVFTELDKTLTTPGEQLYIKLYHLGRQRKSYVTYLLWGDMPPGPEFNNSRIGRRK